MQLFSADAKLSFFKNTFFLTAKSWKNHPQKLLRNTQIFFQPCTAKRPKKKNSVFKMWLKESLSIALGYWRFISSFMTLPKNIFYYLGSRYKSFWLWTIISSGEDYIFLMDKLENSIGLLSVIKNNYLLLEFYSERNY